MEAVTLRVRAVFRFFYEFARRLRVVGFDCTLDMYSHSPYFLGGVNSLTLEIFSGMVGIGAE